MSGLPTRSGDAKPASAPAIAILMKNELLGDAVTRVPALRALRCALPDHRIVGLYRRNTVWTTALSRARAEFFDEIHTGTPARDNVAAIRDVLRGIPNLKIVLDFQSSGRVLSSYFATAGLGVRYVANVAGFVLRRGIAQKPEVRPKSNADRYHRAVELVVGRSLPFSAGLEISEDDRARARLKLGTTERYICLAPGGPGHHKFWSEEKWVSLARHLSGLKLTPVFLIGPNEEQVNGWVRRDLPGAVIIDPAAAENLERLPWLFLAIADGAVGAVAYEGGIGHLIATCNVPILTIAGRTNPKRWRPVTPYHWIAWSRHYGSDQTSAVPLEAVVTQAEEMIRFSDRFRPLGNKSTTTNQREARRLGASYAASEARAS